MGQIRVDLYSLINMTQHDMNTNCYPFHLPLFLPASSLLNSFSAGKFGKCLNTKFARM
jgi:hypothetical protein